ncbi:hypothetical protein YPPY58_1801, partial [Yersinia pestis PY-58]
MIIRVKLITRRVSNEKNNNGCYDFYRIRNYFY